MEAARAALLVPGRLYGPSAPLLWFARAAAQARRAHVEAVDWVVPDDLPDAAWAQWVADQVTTRLDKVTPDYGPPLVIAKSLGTGAAGLAADRGLPAIWLTPLLHLDAVVAGLRRATAPYLLIGGTDDESWNLQLAEDLTPHVLSVAHADHALHVPGRLAASAEVLGRVATAIEDFLDTVVWPT